MTKASADDSGVFFPSPAFWQVMMTKQIARIGVLLLLIALGVQISAAQGTTPPSGEIAFVSDRSGTYQIYLMNADGSDVRQLTHAKVEAYAPIWSPDGQKLLYVDVEDSTHHKLMIMNADGSQPTLINSDIDEIDIYGSCTWSSDSQWLIYTISTGIGETNLLQFHRIKADGSDDQLLNLPPTAKDYFRRVTFFRDANHLLASDLNALYVADADSSHLQLLTSQIQSYPFAISPDSQHIIGIQSGRIIETDSKGNQPQVMFPGLTSKRLDFYIHFFDWLGWSPNGAYIWGSVFVHPNDLSGTPDDQSLLNDEVFIGTANGDDYWLHNPMPDSGYITWSPDSQWIAYATYEAGGHLQIVISQPIGTDQTILTSGSDNSQPAWRPSP